jgi:hypothetical protein
VAVAAAQQRDVSGSLAAAQLGSNVSDVGSSAPAQHRRQLGGGVVAAAAAVAAAR